MQIELSEAERLYLTLAVQGQVIQGQMMLQKLAPQEPPKDESKE